ncbi:MAG: helix-hairpin-helix domain-containing protein [Dehalococcoidia bacterium]|nr:helix-hairpin-helix domain-containing protein [Dehalococcoidia bacterium]
MSRADRLYLFITAFLLIAAIAGGVMLAVQHSRNQPVEIVLSQTEPPQQSGELYIGGAVANPGIYPWQEGDTIQALLLDTGIEPDADLSHIEIYVPREGEERSPQKIDINRAEPWLLEALPGIGGVLAQRIVDYRSENGPFRTIEDLLKVSGIGEGTFEKIKDYITVSD